MKAGGNSCFADNFIRLLGLHALTQRRVAQLLGISEVTVSGWVNAKHRPSLSQAIGVSELFDVDLNRLMNASFVGLLTDDGAGQIDHFERVEFRIWEMQEAGK